MNDLESEAIVPETPEAAAVPPAEEATTTSSNGVDSTEEQSLGEQKEIAASTPQDETEEPTQTLIREPRSDVRRQNNNRPRKDQSRKKPRPPQERRTIDRFVTVSWSGQREPVDTMFWCEAERKGSWIEVTALDQVRTRREILERLTELDSGLVGLDFGFSYPQAFMEFLKENEGVGDWRALLKKVREELKKNVDDGVRVWIERMGKYREANLEPNPMPIRTYERGRYGREMKERQPTLYEQGSMAERFRRTESALRRAAEGALQSTLQVSYNRLTSRYEFSGELQRGRNSLLGLSMLEQLLEAREDLAVWPWKKQGKLTIAEIFPWLFRHEQVATPQQCRILLAAEEDNGTEIPAAARDIICRNPDAQRAFFSMMAMIRTEGRVEKTIRPLRDYPAPFYSDPQIQLEGWFYGVGYKMNNERREPLPKTRPKDRGARTTSDHEADLAQVPIETVLETVIAPEIS